jgi:site-specific recombinase
METIPSTYNLVLESFPEHERGHRELRHLASHLSALTDARSLRERLDSLVHLRDWARASDASLPEPTSSLQQSPSSWRRQHVLHCLVEQSAEVRARFQSGIAAILAETQSVGLFAETGLPSDRGLVAETSDRILRRILPAPREDEDLSKLLVRLFPSEREASRFADTPPELFQRMVSNIAPANQPEMWQPVVTALRDAFNLLGARVQALGLSEKLRARSRPVAVQESPFFRLTRSGDALLQGLCAKGDVASVLKPWQEIVNECRAETEVITHQLETSGVNLDAVYSLDVISQSLGRMEAIVAVLTKPPGLEKNEAIRRLLGLVIHGRLSDRSLIQLARGNLRLLATKIVEHAGKTGEHYIAASRSEYWSMWKAAAGGGLITAVTAAIKLIVAHSGLPLFVVGFLSGLNYATSFVFIQACGFVLATKQPSMTAATFAGIIRRTHQGATRDNELVSYIARICRSQLAAALGNILAVAVAASGFDLLWKLFTGISYLTHEEADHLFQTLDPLHSGTIFYATLTGAILWLSSVVGGWLDNWAIYRRLPQALAEHPLGTILGKVHLERVSRVLSPNVAAWGGSIALGFMLGMTPVLGHFFGLPLDVRHVTLSTGTLAYAVVALGHDWYDRGWFLWASAGIGVTFILNLTVSFTLALRLALRAYDIPAKDRGRLFKVFIRRISQSPREFLLPPKSESSHSGNEARAV